MTIPQFIEAISTPRTIMEIAMYTREQPAIVSRIIKESFKDPHAMVGNFYGKKIFRVKKGISVAYFCRK